MTIDEAIKNVREKERQHRENAEYQLNRNINSPQISLHIKVETRKSEEARQLAEWLEELKKYKSYKPVDKEFYKAGYTKAIQDFVKKLEEHQQENWVDNLEYGITFSDIEQVAEQLKEGGVE